MTEYTAQSHDAEVAWFVRGNTLYRRVLLLSNTMRTLLPPNLARCPDATRFAAETAGIFGSRCDDAVS